MDAVVLAAVFHLPLFRIDLPQILPGLGGNFSWEEYSRFLIVSIDKKCQQFSFLIHGGSTVSPWGNFLGRLLEGSKSIAEFERRKSVTGKKHMRVVLMLCDLN